MTMTSPMCGAKALKGLQSGRGVVGRVGGGGTTQAMTMIENITKICGHKEKKKATKREIVYCQRTHKLIFSNKNKISAPSGQGERGRNRQRERWRQGRTADKIRHRQSRRDSSMSSSYTRTRTTLDVEIVPPITAAAALPAHKRASSRAPRHSRGRRQDARHGLPCGERCRWGADPGEGTRRISPCHFACCTHLS